MDKWSWGSGGIISAVVLCLIVFPFHIRWLFPFVAFPKFSFVIWIKLSSFLYFSSGRSEV